MMMIRTFLLSAFILVAFTSCQENTGSNDAASDETTATPTAAAAAAGNAGASAEVTTAEWAAVEHDFGSIPQGTPVTHTFKVTNTGDQPMKISNVKASCGCTATDYSKEVIPPGGEGFVQARYNAASPGVFNKSVTVTYNVAKQRELLRLKGTVVGQ